MQTETQKPKNNETIHAPESAFTAPSGRDIWKKTLRVSTERSTSEPQAEDEADLYSQIAIDLGYTHILVGEYFFEVIDLTSPPGSEPLSEVKLTDIRMHPDMDEPIAYVAYDPETLMPAVDQESGVPILLISPKEAFEMATRMGGKSGTYEEVRKMHQEMVAKKTDSKIIVP